MNLDFLKSLSGEDPRTTLTLDQQLIEMRRRIVALQEIESHLDSKEFHWLTDKYLPLVKRELESKRTDSDPEDTKAQIVFHAKLEAMSNLTKKLSEVSGEIMQLERASRALERQRDRLASKNAKKGR